MSSRPYPRRIRGLALSGVWPWWRWLRKRDPCSAGARRLAAMLGELWRRHKDARCAVPRLGFVVGDAVAVSRRRLGFAHRGVQHKAMPPSLPVDLRHPLLSTWRVRRPCWQCWRMFVRNWVGRRRMRRAVMQLVVVIGVLRPRRVPWRRAVHVSRWVRGSRLRLTYMRHSRVQRTRLLQRWYRNCGQWAINGPIMAINN